MKKSELPWPKKKGGTDLSSLIKVQEGKNLPTSKVKRDKLPGPGADLPHQGSVIL